MGRKNPLNDERKTLTINVAATIRSVPIMLTTEIARQVVAGASYISLAHTCVCRDERSCKNFPKEFGCLYLGQGARGIVEKGHAREITCDEALKHIDTAKGLGLINMILWTSQEIRALGGEANRALELCSCCPCCCISRRTGNGQQAYIDGIQGLGIARTGSGCTSCEECARVCPLQAIHVSDDGPEINADRCRGCGLCVSACAQNVLEINPLEQVQTYDKGWKAIDTKAYFEEIMRTVR